MYFDSQELQSALFLKKTLRGAQYSALLMVRSAKRPFFFFEQTDPNGPVQDQLAKRPLFSFFGQMVSYILTA